MACALSLGGINPADIESLLFKPVGGRFERIEDRQQIADLCRRHRMAHVKRDHERRDTWFATAQPGIDCLRIKLKAKK